MVKAASEISSKSSLVKVCLSITVVKRGHRAHRSPLGGEHEDLRPDRDCLRVMLGWCLSPVPNLLAACRGRADNPCPSLAPRPAEKQREHPPWIKARLSSQDKKIKMEIKPHPVLSVNPQHSLPMWKLV